jgi:hypothetical protein
MNTNIPITNPTIPPNAVSVLNWLHAFSDIWPSIAAIIVLLGFLIALWRVRSEIRDEVIAHVTKDDFIQRLASLSRPHLIFDEDLSILADRGASSFVKPGGIHIEKGNPMGGSSQELPIEIKVEFCKHLSTAPILTSIVSDGVSITSRRGKFHDWIFKLEYAMTIGVPDNFKRSYRLEIF